MQTRAWTAAIAAMIGASGCGAMKAEPRAAMGAAPADHAAIEAAQAGELPLMMIDQPTRATPLEPAADAAELNARTAGEWAVVREFAVATYDPADTTRHDFRETIFWAPEVHTGADGRATVQFPTSDAITAFRITAEGIAGGLPGHAETTIASRLPLSLAANLPVEVTTGDRISLPVTITNNATSGVDAAVHATTGAALVVAGTSARTIHVPGRSARTVTYQLDVRGTDSVGAAGDIELVVEAGTARDALRRSLKIVPNGFPASKSFAGTVAAPVKHTLTVPASAVTGSVHTTIKLYPSPLATMTAGAPRR